jgi:hypothetical protein
MYGPENLWEGYLVVGDSFLASGFASQAIGAYNDGEVCLGDSGLDSSLRKEIADRFQSSRSRAETVLESSSIDDLSD